ncbi:hypothetical protein [Roseiconus lacunae]|uniref:hypothetical protein n=1 Tax=Roseiconus lacunae TaxID=2605694 RepID=UPI001E55D65D|nr:hypothetical protein [Roseiconus lacunae]MCD0459087.1 hypothetical protein [Roseiconus lacunae]
MRLLEWFVNRGDHVIVTVRTIGAFDLTSNPYASSNEEVVRPMLPDITEEELSTLLTDETASRHDVFGDVADVNLYGFKHRRTLSGAASQRMIDAGLEPTVRQAVEWWCFVFVPVFPIGTRIVASYRDDLPDGDDHGRSIPTAMDWRQASVHATLGILGLAIVTSVIVSAIWRA